MVTLLKHHIVIADAQQNTMKKKSDCFMSKERSS